MKTTIEPMVEIPQRALDQIHERNKRLDVENRQKDKEIDVLMEVVERLTLGGCRLRKQVV